jgi:multiple sugar transport system permease protein
MNPSIFKTRNFPKLPKAADLFAYLVVAMMFLFAIFPIYWVVNTAFKPLGEFQTYPPTFIPSKFTTENIDLALNQFGGKDSIQDSAIIALGTFALSMLVAIPAGYSLARYNTGGNFLAFNILSFRFMPPIVPVVAFFTIASELEVFDTYYLLIAANSLPIIPFVVWIMKGFFDEIPVEIEEAAQLDGANWFQLMWRVVLPLAAPGIVSASLFSIVFAWNEMLFAMVLTGRNIEPITKQIPAIRIGSQEPHWGALAAMGLIMIVPVIFLSFFLQRYIIRGLTYGAVK